jgi:polysaccharide export outer membrane protein
MKTKMLLSLVCIAIGLLGGTPHLSAQALRVGDSFDLRIGGVPADDISNISSNYTVDGEGCLNLAYLNKIHVAGMTPSQIQNVIEKAYEERGIFTHPTVTLSIAASARFVNVSGQVKNPSRVPYTPDMTVMSAINAANDFNDYADQKNVRLIRNGSIQIINCKKARQDPSLDIKVQPGDSIMVPQSWL